MNTFSNTGNSMATVTVVRKPAFQSAVRKYLVYVGEQTLILGNGEEQTVRVPTGVPTRIWCAGKRVFSDRKCTKGYDLAKATFKPGDYMRVEIVPGFVEVTYNGKVIRSDEIR